MPDKRIRNNENKGLHKGWRYRYGAYYYRVPRGMESRWDDKKEYKLGDTLAEAHKAFAEKMKLLENPKIKYLWQLMDRYALEVIPKKGVASRLKNEKEIIILRKVFGHKLAPDVTPQEIYIYYDKRKSKAAAKREIALFSHICTKGVEWGALNKHPFLGQVKLPGSKPRDRYIEDWEIIEALALEPTREKGSVLMIQAYIRLKLQLGLRQSDMLRLQESDIQKDGLHAYNSKTKRPVVYQWSEELRKSIEIIKTVRPIDISPYLFCTRKGRSYLDERTGRPGGFKSVWQRFMKRLIKETTVKRFTEHDLRAKCASDAESLEHARQLLAHADSRTTSRFYRRKTETIKPGKGINA
jgi:integrase